MALSYRDAVNDHNNLRHALPLLEDTWMTIRWPVHVFTFLLALTKTNVYLALSYFVYVGAKKNILPKYLKFRRKLAWQFIDNPYLPNTRAEPVSPFFTQLVDHTIQTPPPHARIYINQKWVTDAKMKYPQFICTVPGCKKPSEPIAHVPQVCGYALATWLNTLCTRLRRQNLAHLIKWFFFFRIFGVGFFCVLEIVVIK